jgi:hypothetical protein
MEVNAFRMTDDDGTPVGLCFDPTLARANHSCRPNAVIEFAGRQVSLIALRPIAKGEEVCISYIGMSPLSLKAL